MREERRKQILQSLDICPEILSDEEWEWLDRKITEAQTPPPNEGFTLGPPVEDDD